MEILNILITSFWFQAIVKLFLGFLLAGLIGLERSSWSKPAGFRTHALLGLSAVLIMLCGEYMSRIYPDMDPSRIPAQLLSGIGFLGAGTILRDGFNVKGLTTAAGLLTVTCIGLSIGAGFYLGGIATTFIAYIILSYSYKISEKLDHFDIMELNLKIEGEVEDTINKIQEIISENEIEIKNLKKLDKEDEEDFDMVELVLQYHKNINVKNKIISKISLLKNIKEVVEE